MRLSVPSVLRRFVPAKLSSKCLRSFFPASAVASWTIASGIVSATTSRVAPGSSTSRIIGVAPSARSRSALDVERDVPTTSWPRSTS
jgi:hypothetical protein